MKRANGRWILILIMLLIDWYVFKAFKTIAEEWNEKARIMIFSLYWMISGLSIIYILFLPYFYSLQSFKSFRNYVFALVVGLFVAKLIACIFLLIDDLKKVFIWVYAKLAMPHEEAASFTNEKISRSVFLNWLSIGMGSLFMGTFIYGFTNKYNYRVRKLNLKFKNLPKAFHGFKIVQLSDIHSGSLQNISEVKRGIQMVLDEKADMIVLTGDLVNDKEDELNQFKNIFNKLKAPYGVYSILGNHDYGDYYQWPSEKSKAENLKKLIQTQKELGYNLLLNENVSIEKAGESIFLIGVENWSAKGNFPKHGDLKKACKGVDKSAFQILLSHDPSHWDNEVIKTFNDIDLTLSGHTHGMQFGVELPQFKWSPVQYMYPHWAGLYQNGKQKLYVNRGFGFIGYPGRVGILPEITSITLFCDSD